MKQPEAVSNETVIRRRRTRRHRRNRQIRRALQFVVVLALAFGFAFASLQYLTPSLFRGSQSQTPQNAALKQSTEVGRDLLLPAPQEALRAVEDHPVYPYSVVAGGVKDARELKWMADHDPVVRAHYAGFDYDHARVVRLVLARTAYVSYRIGNKVYWTRHRVSLKKGETVITDGKMTARTRCANRVEEVPQQATSSSEPPVAKMETPAQPATGTAFVAPPVPFQSALMNRPGVPGLGPALPLGVYDPFTNGTWVPIAPPPLPGVCGIGKKHTGGGTGKGKGNPCAPGTGGEVPEPGTWLLVASGLAVIYWKTRHRFART